MNLLRYIIIPVFTLFLIVGLNFKFVNIPPLGKFLDPYHGYLSLIGRDDITHLDINYAELTAPVTIKFDSLRIPHIFAENEEDLYFAQGYVMAFDRLWQMEFQTHAAGGRVSEIIGEKALPYDRFQRRIGMVYGAEKGLAEIQKDPVYPNLLAFTKGVNAFIESLGVNDYPLEYKILDYTPEPWTPLKTSLLLKYMAWMLTGQSNDLVYTRLLNDFGIEVVNNLYPVFPKDFEPIIPRGTNFNFGMKDILHPASFYKTQADTSDILIRELVNSSHLFNAGGFEGIGSNNWAVHGSRTKSGNAILANDPHLGLSLPSIWYAMHLHCPTMNVMGVTLPGAPGIILGFNDNISWGFTNGYDDVMDWYDIQFRDNQLQEYWYGNSWQKTTKVIEEIKIRGEKSFFDTVTYTHHGPIVWDRMNQTLPGGENNIPNKLRQTSPGRALRWLAHDPSNELRSLYLVNKAENYNDFVEALKFFTCPGQNIIYSDTEGNIAIWHAGNLPVKWKGQGRFIMDGSDPAYDWQERIPHDEKAHSLNPSRGFLSSANQHPVDETYPYYMSEFFWHSYRGEQINKRLSTLKSASLEEIRNIQLDNISGRARNLLPVFLSKIEKFSLNTSAKKWAALLKEWNYSYDALSVEATFYDHWEKLFEKMVWTDNFGQDNQRYIWPYFNSLDELVRYNPESHWFDDTGTKEVETLSDLCYRSFSETVEKFGNMEKFGIEKLQWQYNRQTDLNHLAKIPGMGRINLPTSGAPDIVNATGETFGPSWRFAIEMGERKTVYGIYPGGQSGHPGSIFYDNMVDDWVIGNYHLLSFPHSPEELTGVSFVWKPK
ncbi:MAG: penicillin acylase family protein [Candidatus Marinimicrobia bacterium]|nr:penicillin acylase family protein [Candidatus Neomarinimicrobiota bacterium]